LERRALLGSLGKSAGSRRAMLGAPASLSAKYQCKECLTNDKDALHCWNMKRNKKYILGMVLGINAYAFGITALRYFFKDEEHSPHKFWLILLPILPLLYVVAAIIRGVTELDEMQRKIQIEAMAFSGLATGFTCFSYLFFRDTGAPEFHAQWAFYMMCAYYWIGLFCSWRRYK
jgi:hypothetical protein